MKRGLPSLIRRWLNKQTEVPAGVRHEGDISPFDIFALSSVFPRLDLSHENLILAAYQQASNPSFLLTDQNLFIKSIKNVVIIPFEKITPETLRSNLETPYAELLVSLFEAINQPETVDKDKKGINDFLKKVSSVNANREEEKTDGSLFFDQAYLDLLAHECSAMAELGVQLNHDDLFVQALNLAIDQGDQSIDGYKAEHLLIADLIKAYNKLAFAENEKGRFTFACFFEQLQGNCLCQSGSLQRLNEMAANPAFIENINKLKAADYIGVSDEYKGQFMVPSILLKIGHPLMVRSGNLIYRFASLIAKANGSISDEEKTALTEVLNLASKPSVNKKSARAREVPKGDTIELVMAELNSLVGLTTIKTEVAELTNLLKIQKIRKEKGLIVIPSSLHAVFSGPPGTGKTTIARLLGRIYKHLGLLSEGHVVETDRAGLVAGYVGQTALKVDELINESKGGVLFIDEAYSLVAGDNPNDFGNEAIDALLKRMEDNRENLAVVVAGYTEPMKEFIESNPGLRSRFSRYFYFDHFSPEQLFEIVEGLAQKHDFKLNDEAAEKLKGTFQLLYERKDEGFGNARVVRNLFEKCIQLQANRLVQLPEIDEQQLQTIGEPDVPEPKDTLKQTFNDIEN